MTVRTARMNRILKSIPVLLGVLLVSCMHPQQVHAQISVRLQNAAIANGNGEVLPTNVQATAVFTVNCAGCAGGTQVNFEGTSDGTSYAGINSTLSTGASTGTSTTSSGITIWVLPVAGMQNVRARISAYSSGIVTVTGVAVPLTGGAGGGGSGGGVVSGTVGIDQVTANANEIVCKSGCSGGTTDADDGTVAGGQTTGLQIGETYVYDGSNWKRATIGTAGSASAQVQTIQGVASMTPVLATLSGTNNIATVSAVTAISSALPAGTNVIGHVIADSGSTVAVSGTTTLTPGTGAANLGKAEDAVAASGDTGVSILAVASATPSATAADGDYIAVKTNANGVLWANDIHDSTVGSTTSGQSQKLAGTATTTAAPTYTTAQSNPLSTDVHGGLRATLQDSSGVSLSAISDPCNGLARTSIPIHTSSATTTVLAAASSGNKYYICAFNILPVSGAINLELVEDATGSCASPDAGVMGGTTDGTGAVMTTGQGWSMNGGSGTMASTASTNVNLCLITSTTVKANGNIMVVAAP